MYERVKKCIFFAIIYLNVDSSINIETIEMLT